MLLQVEELSLLYKETFDDKANSKLSAVNKNTDRVEKVTHTAHYIYEQAASDSLTSESLHKLEQQMDTAMKELKNAQEALRKSITRKQSCSVTSC